MTNSHFIKSVVFAEDDEDDRILFKDVVEEMDADITVQIVHDGKQLLELLNQFLPDILFLDLEMPYKNGLQCLLEIRARPSLSQMPIVVFSSTTRPSNIQTACEMGAHLFLIKSSVFSEYKESLKKILKLDWSRANEIKNRHCVNEQFHAFFSEQVE
jgi:CheY-like chemotaxis protein